MINAEPGQMKVSMRPAERSSVVLEVEFPADRVRRQIDESVRHLARRTKVPGFRPGKVPRPLLERALGVRRDDPDAENPIYDDAKEHLFERSVLEAVRDQDLDVLSIPEPEWFSFDEAGGAAYRITLPLRPQVKLGAYTDYPFGITIDETTDESVDSVIDFLSPHPPRRPPAVWDEAPPWRRPQSRGRRRAATLAAVTKPCAATLTPLTVNVTSSSSPLTRSNERSKKDDLLDGQLMRPI